MPLVKNSRTQEHPAQKSKGRRILWRVSAVVLFVGAALLCFAGPTAGEIMISLWQGKPLCIPWTGLQAEAKGQHQVATFRIYNLSLKTVRLEAEADCGCTSLSWQNTQLPAFANCTLTANYSAATGKGRTESNRILIRSNLPEAPSQWLTVRRNR